MSVKFASKLAPTMGLLPNNYPGLNLRFTDDFWHIPVWQFFCEFSKIFQVRLFALVVRVNHIKATLGEGRNNE
jgi:hypothetical protein